MRYLLALLAVLIFTVLTLRSKHYERSGKLPIYLKADPIAEGHETVINFKNHSKIKIDEGEVDKLLKDYKSLWAHLNYLYTSGDVVAGKEYYTEDFFKSLCVEDEYNPPFTIKRQDLEHNFYLQNWSKDNLVCTLIDSNAVFKHSFPSGKEEVKTQIMALVLLFQGDHWRLDAIKYLNNN